MRGTTLIINECVLQKKTKKQKNFIISLSRLYITVKIKHFLVTLVLVDNCTNCHLFIIIHYISPGNQVYLYFSEIPEDVKG